MAVWAARLLHDPAQEHVTTHSPRSALMALPYTLPALLQHQPWKAAAEAVSHRLAGYLESRAFKAENAIALPLELAIQASTLRIARLLSYLQLLLLKAGRLVPWIQPCSWIQLCVTCNCIQLHNRSDR